MGPAAAPPPLPPAVARAAERYVALADALAYRRREPSRLRLPATERGRRTAEFVLEVVASARDAAGTASHRR